MSWLTPAVFIVVACMAVYTIVRAVRERRRREKRLREGYYMTFRCRLCGKTFTNGGTGDKETAWTATANAAFTASGIGPLKKLENQPLVQETHCCEDGSFGVADFLGMKRAEDCGDEKEV